MQQSDQKSSPGGLLPSENREKIWDELLAPPDGILARLKDGSDGRRARQGKIEEKKLALDRLLAQKLTSNALEHINHITGALAVLWAEGLLSKDNRKLFDFIMDCPLRAKQLVRLLSAVAGKHFLLDQGGDGWLLDQNDAERAMSQARESFFAEVVQHLEGMISKKIEYADLAPAEQQKADSMSEAERRAFIKECHYTKPHLSSASRVSKKNEIAGYLAQTDQNLTTQQIESIATSLASLWGIKGVDVRFFLKNPHQAIKFAATLQNQAIKFAATPQKKRAAMDPAPDPAPDPDLWASLDRTKVAEAVVDLRAANKGIRWGLWVPVIPASVYVLAFFGALTYSHFAPKDRLLNQLLNTTPNKAVPFPISGIILIAAVLVIAVALWKNNKSAAVEPADLPGSITPSKRK